MTARGSGADLDSPPAVLVVMGVSGCGKTTLARALAEALVWEFIEADDHHSAANRAHMAAGRPLTDAMREPFVASLCAAIRACAGGCVLAFSALRRAHRERIRALGRPTLFLHLHGTPALIGARLAARAEHFMPASLLESQFEALESPRGEPDACELPVEWDPGRLSREALALVQQRLPPSRRV